MGLLTPKWSLSIHCCRCLQHNGADLAAGARLSGLPRWPPRSVVNNQASPKARSEGGFGADSGHPGRKSLSRHPLDRHSGADGTKAENLGRASYYDAIAIDYPIVGCPPMGEVILGLCLPVLCLSDTCVQAVRLTISGV